MIGDYPIPETRKLLLEQGCLERPIHFPIVKTVPKGWYILYQKCCPTCKVIPWEKPKFVKRSGG